MRFLVQYDRPFKVIIFIVLCGLINGYLALGCCLVSGFIYLVAFRGFPEKSKPIPKELSIEPGQPHRINKGELDEILFPKSKRASSEMDDMINLIIRDFVLSWFERIDNGLESEFPDSVKLILKKVIQRLYGRIVELDLVSFTVFKLIPLLTKHVNIFCVAREAILSDRLLDKTVIRDGDLKLAIEFNNIYRLHRCISLKPDQLEKDIELYIDKCSEELINTLVDEKETNSLFPSVLGREILSKNILTPLIVKFYNPDRWNLLLISLSKKILNERNQVQEVKTILTRELQHNKIEKTAEIQAQESHDFTLSEGITAKEFEVYLRRLSYVKSITDLRTGKFLLTTTLLKQEHNKNLTGKNTHEYIRRLKLSLNLIDNQLKHIAPLSIETNVSTKCMRSNFFNDNDVLNNDNVIRGFESIAQPITLDALLNDEYCLSYFKTFLNTETHKRGLEFLKYLKCVETFKNPLEDAKQDDILIEASQTDITHLNYIAEEFLQNEELSYMKSLDEGLVSNILLFTSNDPAVLGQNGFLLARKSMLLLQTEAETILEREYLVKYKKSEIFLKMISSPDFINTALYSKYFDFEKNTRNIREQSSSNRKLSLSGVTILTNPGINEALDMVLNGNDTKGVGYNTTNNNINSQIEQPTLSHDLTSLDESKNDKLFKGQLFSNNTSPVKSKKPLHSLNSAKLGKMDFNDTYSTGTSIKAHIDSVEYSSLKPKIGDLTLEINHLQKEIELLNHLILKADLTNNQDQLKLLNRSQKALLKEMKNKDLLKQQLMVEQNAASLYQKTNVSIRSHILDYEVSNLREVAYYVIYVTHTNERKKISWEIPRRYTEFDKLNTYLKKFYKSYLSLVIEKEIFPSKMAIPFKYHSSQSSLYEKRKRAFQSYLRELLKIPEICQDEMFRRFLTNSQPFSATILPSKIDKMPEKSEFSYLPNSLLSPQSKEQDNENKSQNLEFENYPSTSSSISPTPQLNITGQEEHLPSKCNSDGDISAVRKQSNSDILNGHISYVEKNSNKKSFIRPISDLFISIFSTSSINKNSSSRNDYWLRGGAIILVLQQLFGSTIDKYIQDNILKLKSEPKLYDFLFQTKIHLWGPGGFFEMRQKSKLEPLVIRSELEKRRTYSDSKLLFQALIIELSGKVVGLRHSKEASAKIHDILQNPYLNTSLLLEIMDLILNEVIFNNPPASLDNA